MKRIYHYNSDGETIGYSERPPTAAEAKADLGFALLALAVAIVAIILAPLIYPFFPLNRLLTETINREWHLSFRLLIFAAANTSLLLLEIAIFLFAPRHLVNAAGAVAYGVYGFGATALVTVDPNSKWAIRTALPQYSNYLPETIRDGDIIWSVVALVTAATLGWIFFNLILRKLRR